MDGAGKGSIAESLLEQLNALGVGGIVSEQAPLPELGLIHVHKSCRKGAWAKESMILKGNGLTWTA